MAEMNRKEKLRALQSRYFDRKARIAMIGAPRELLIMGHQRNEMIQKMLLTIDKIQNRLEVVFNRSKDDVGAETMFAFEIGELHKYAKVLRQDPNNLLECQAAFAIIVGISEGIKEYEVFYNTGTEETADAPE